MSEPGPIRIAVCGGSGFVGRALVAALTTDGFVPVVVAAPRISVEFGTDPDLSATSWIGSDAVAFGELIDQLRGCSGLVNAAGLATPTSSDTPDLWGADAVLPSVLARAAAGAGVDRFVHVSSAAVQGSQAVLDEGEPTSAHSPYARAKAGGETVLTKFRAETSSGLEVVTYRPTSVLGSGRPIARRLASVLLSRWLVLPGGDAELPVALVNEVGRAASFLVTCPNPPETVVHPSEGMTVRSLATAFGRERPIATLPGLLAKPVVALVRALASGGPLAGRVRRIELLFDGQRQVSSLPDLGFRQGDLAAGYRSLGDELGLIEEASA